jgi:hypothetical protein
VVVIGPVKIVDTIEAFGFVLKIGAGGFKKLEPL